MRPATAGKAGPSWPTCYRRGVPPLVVGGTGLYLKALLYGLFGEGEPQSEVRERLGRELHGLGLPVLHRRLTALDPVTAARLHPHDTYRILRALEVMEATGRPLSELFAAHRFRDCPYRVVKLGLTLPREELQARIEARVEAMLAQGFLAGSGGAALPLPRRPETLAIPGLPPSD